MGWLGICCKSMDEYLVESLGELTSNDSLGGYAQNIHGGVELGRGATVLRVVTTININGTNVVGANLELEKSGDKYARCWERTQPTNAAKQDDRYQQRSTKFGR